MSDAQQLPLTTRDASPMQFELTEQRSVTIGVGLALVVCVAAVIAFVRAVIIGDAWTAAYGLLGALTSGVVFYRLELKRRDMNDIVGLEARIKQNLNDSLAKYFNARDEIDRAREKRDEDREKRDKAREERDKAREERDKAREERDKALYDAIIQKLGV